MLKTQVFIPQTAELGLDMKMSNRNFAVSSTNRCPAVSLTLAFYDFPADTSGLKTLTNSRI
jgi:hypothetical protein